MTPGTYVVFLGTSSQSNLLCLGTSFKDSARICSVERFDPNSDANTWILVPVPGGEGVNGFFLQHQKSRLTARFGNSDSIRVDAFVPSSRDSYLRLDGVGDGFVAINNYADDKVMDASGDNPTVGAIVAPHSWNQGNNQRWRFVSTVMFSGLA